MTSTENTVQKTFIEKIEGKLDALNVEFLTPYDLFQIGIFSSRQAANDAVLSGAISGIQISQKRILIDKSAVLSFLRKRSISEKV